MSDQTACWLVITQRLGREEAALYHGMMPSYLATKEGREHHCVVDIVPLDSRQATLSLATVYAEYRRDKAFREANEKHPLPVSGAA